MSSAVMTLATAGALVIGFLLPVAILTNSSSP